VLRKTAFVFVAMVLMLGLSTSAFAQKKVVRVVVVKTDNPAAYAQLIESGKEIMKRLGLSSETHVYQAQYAGTEAGTVVATIEYPSLAALADADAKTRADKDYQAWIKNLNAVRTIVSDSIFREL
jgi:ABC-type sugar transport system substrate-binding protein